MSPMESAYAQASLQSLLLASGLVVALALALRERSNRPDRAALTRAIVERSWSTPQVGGLLTALFALFILADYVVDHYFYPEQIPYARLVATYIVYGVLTLQVWGVNRFRGFGWADGLGLGRRAARKSAWAPLLYLAMIPFIMLISKAYHLGLEALMGREHELQNVAEVVSEGPSSGLALAYMFTAVMIAPVYEEIIFRGVVFPYFAKRGGLIGGVVFSSILFAVMHFDVPSLVPLGLLSAGLSLAYWRSGSLWLCVVTHAVFNAATIFALNL